MIKLITVLLIFLSLSASAYAQQPLPYQPGPGALPPGSVGSNALKRDASNASLPAAHDNLGTAVFSILDNGAKCDGVTDDTAAINATFAAARSSAVYIAGGSVVVQGLAKQQCATTQINATGFTQSGAASQVVVRDLTLLCAGAGNICFDKIGSLHIDDDNLVIIGSASSPPLIGLQEGNSNPTTAACCIITHSRSRIEGSFTFSAVYEAASESTQWLSPIIRNNGATTGAIVSLGTVTGGSGYTNGTYTQVPLTGGTGAGAIGTVVVSGGAVASLSVTQCFHCYQGKGYAVGDTLSAATANIGGAGSGFSVPVATIGQFAAVEDGENHWRLSSPFQTITWTPDTYYTYSQVNWFGGSIRYINSTEAGAPLWMTATNGHRFHEVYFESNAATEDVEFFDNGVQPNIAPFFSGTFESTSTAAAFFIYGANITPTINNGTYLITNQEGQTAVFLLDTNITLVTAEDIDVHLVASSAVVPLFYTPSIWTFSGTVIVPSQSYLTLSQLSQATSFNFCTPTCQLVTNSVWIAGNGAVNSGDSLTDRQNTTGTVSSTFRNSGLGVATRWCSYLANSTSNTEAQICLNGGSFSGGLGANGFYLNSLASEMELQGNGTDFLDYGISTASVLTMPQPTTLSNATVRLSALAAAAGANQVCSGTGGLLTTVASGTACASSALDTKDPVEVLDTVRAAKAIRSLRGAFWTYKNTKMYGTQQYGGLYADDVAKMDPRCVTRRKNGKVDNYYDRCVLAYLTATVQQQGRDLAALKAAR